MYSDLQEFLDDDHVVPDQSVPEESQTVVALYYPTGDLPSKSAAEPDLSQEVKPFGKQTRRQVSELWADIEDLLALENGDYSASVPHCADTPGSTNATATSEVTQTTTPDFSLLIATTSPQASTNDVQEVPLNSSTSPVSNHSLASDVTNELDISVLQTRTEEAKALPLDDDGTVLTSLNTVSVGTGVDSTAANERTRGTMESVMHQMRNPLNMDYGHYDLYNNGFDVMDDVDSFMQGGPCGVVLEERIRYACTVLDIPMDPNKWTVDQVQKWAMFVLKRDDGVILDSDSIMGLTLDGATLTRMTKDDLINYFPTIGETLYNELEVWCFGITSPLASGTISQLPSEPEYVDLDNFTKNKTYDVITPTYPSSPLQSPPSSVTSSIPSLTSPDDALLPPLCSLMPGHTTYIKPEMAERDDVSATCSELSSVTPSIGGFSNYSSYSPSSSSCGNSSTDDFFDDHESASQTRGHVMPDHRHGGKHTIQLWQFLKSLLLQPQYESYIRWLDRGKGIFKIEDSAYVAKLWGRRKNRPAMNYDKLSRSIRQYYKKGIIKKTGQSKRLVYQFCPQYNS